MTARTNMIEMTAERTPPVERAIALVLKILRERATAMAQEATPKSGVQNKRRWS
jgi:hypothetical protein